MSTGVRTPQPLLERSTTHVALLGGGILLTLLQYVSVWSVMLWLVVLVSGGLLVWVMSSYITGRPTTHRHIPPEPPDRQAAKAFLAKLMGQKSGILSNSDKFVTNGKLDETIQKLLDLVIRDFVLSWYQELGTDQDRFKNLFQDFIWQMVGEFARRINQIDINHFIAHKILTILTKHLKEIQIARKKCKSRAAGPKFVLHPWLASEELEMEFIRQAAEVFLIHLMPQQYVQCVNARHLCRDVLASKMFKPCVEKLCDPNYINECLLSAVHHQEEVKTEMSSLCAEGAGCDQYIQLIADCDNLHQLHLIKYNIISHMLQTVANNNFCKAAPDLSPKTSKQCKARNGLDGSETHNLKKLSVVMQCCEEKIEHLTGSSHVSKHSPPQTSEQISGHKAFPFKFVISNKAARNLFLAYLFRSDDCELLYFWAAVEELRVTAKEDLEKKLDEICGTYIRPECSKVRKYLQTSALTALSSTQHGDIAAVCMAGQEIYTVLETQFYPPFIHSDLFHSLNDSQSTAADNTSPAVLELHQSCLEDLQNITQLGDRLNKEMYRLQTMLEGHSDDIQIEKIRCELQERILEIEQMKDEQKHIEMRINYGKLWLEHKWKMHISNVEIMEEGGERMMKFVGVVHKVGAMSTEGSDSWVLIRTLQDFHILHSQLTQMQFAMRTTELPCIEERPDLSPDFLHQAKSMMQHYINEVLSNENLATTEPVFDFCCPTTEGFPPLHISGVLGNITSVTCSDSSTQTSDTGPDKAQSQNTDQRCVVTAALYGLLCEVFDQKQDKGGMMRLSETITVFLHTAYGTTVNSYIESTISWLCSEAVLVYLVEQVLSVFWNDGQFVYVNESPPQPPTKTHVKQTLLNHIPATLRSLVGEPNCRQGFSKTFEAFQDARLNKHLFYNLLQEFMMEIFPELKAAHKQPSTH